MIHATPACSNISDAALFFLFSFFDFFPNTRNTRGVTKGFLVGEHQQSHYAKYEYPPDDSIHALPGGRHTWSTVRRRRTPSHLRDLNSINRRDSAARRSTGSPLAMFASTVSDGVGATMGVQGSPLAMFASAVSDGVGATMGAWDSVSKALHQRCLLPLCDGGRTRHA